MIRFSPFDLNVILRLALGLIAWRYLSLDLSALPQLVHGPDLHRIPWGWLDNAVGAAKLRFLAGPQAVTVAQLVAVALCAGAAVHLRRWTIALAVVPVLFLELSLYQYRHMLPELEVSLAILLIAMVYPERAPYEHMDRTPTEPATRLGIVLALYAGSTYLHGALTKLALRPFYWEQLHLQNFPAFMRLDRGVTMPEWLDPVASGLAGFYAMPGISVAGAVTVIVVEGLWVGAVFLRPVRLVVPPAMFALHVAIFLSSSIIFFSTSIIAFATVLPWRRLIPASEPAPDDEDVPLALFSRPVYTYAAAAGVIALCLVPYWLRLQVPPFITWGAGVTMADTVGEHEVFALGYRTPDGGYAPIPYHHGGFMDYKMNAAPARHLKRYRDTADTDALAALTQYSRALRPFRSNRRWLWWFAAPPHVLAGGEAVDLDAIDAVYFLQGRLTVEPDGLDLDWNPTPFGELPFPPDDSS